MESSRSGHHASIDRRQRPPGGWPPPAVPALFVLACLAVVGRTAIAGGQAPVIACGPGGTGQRCLVSRLPPILSDREAAPYLKSGLTSMFMFTLSARDERGQRMTAAMRVEVRFEPWDEVFFVSVVRPGIASEQFRLESLEKLQSWWRALGLPFALAAASAGVARLEVTLLPFSGEEETATRQWYAEALRVERRQAGGQRQTDDRRRVSDGSLDRDSLRVGEMLDAMTLTSIKRHGVLRFEWSVPVEHAPR
jgi:hypothetical protein